MRLVILGASGRTGNHLVRHAIGMGHEVTAYVRKPSKLPLSHERLRVIIGDARNRFGLDRVVFHADAVINAISLGADEPESTLIEITDNIVASMQKYNIKRFVGICDTHVHSPHAHRGVLTGRLSSLLLSPSAGRFARMSQLFVDRIAQSKLSWSIVRTHQLNDDAFTGQYIIDTANHLLNARVSRSNAADFLLRIAVNGSHMNELPIISNS